ncbi:MAG: arylsulfatase [Isosphaeraceae bacterium]
MRILALLAAGSVLWHAGPARADGPARPNIVLIVADDLGYGDLGCYGQREVKTPNIDRLAAEGTRFTQCYAGSTVCAPSRCALMTGLHTGHARIRGNAPVPLKPEDVTLARVLQNAGYATGLVGKWGLGDADTTGIPNAQGFGTFFGFLNQHHAHNYYPEYLWTNTRRTPLAGNVVGKADNVSVERAQYAPDLFEREALRFIDEHQKGTFFLFLASILPHANNERGRADGNGMEVPSDAPYSDKPWPAPQKNHAAMITRLDDCVGKVVARLKALGLDQNTLILFSSDNGPHKEGGGDPAFFRSSGGLRGFKRALYDGGVRVPMIARWPGKVPAGAVSEQVWAFWDLLPTLAEVAAAEAPKGLDGVSVAPVILGKKAEVSRPPLYWEFHEGGFAQAARDGRWKAVRPQRGRPTELYDISADPSESRNVAADHPEVVARLDAFLRSARVDSPDFPVRNAPAPARKAR